MKNILLLFVVSTTMLFASCSSKNCKECTNCDTKSNATLCEDDFEKTSDYNDKLDDMISDGCACKDD
ncbi:MAG: hypothetical protein P1U41_05615 [Vicingaceae bacterium]|nr:hypothetical protein [Vicingaceae bacterium]